MSIINSGTFNDFVANMRVTFKKGYEYVPQVAKQLYDVRDMGAGVGDIFRASEIDGPELATRFNDGVDIPSSTVQQGYSKNVQVYRVGGSIAITWWMRHHGKYPEMNQSIMKLGTSVAERMDLDLTHRFTFSTATSYVDKDGTTVSTTSGDALSMLSTVHTVTGSSTTYRNRIANNPAFSIGGLEAGESIGYQQMIDNNGRRVFPHYDTIVTGMDANTCNVVAKVLNSISPRDEANAGVANPYKAKYRHVKLPYLDSTATGAYDSTKNKYWFLVDSSNSGLMCYVTEQPHMTTPTPAGHGENFWNENWTFKASATYGLELLQPRGIIGSTGDGTA